MHGQQNIKKTHTEVCHATCGGLSGCNPLFWGAGGCLIIFHLFYSQLFIRHTLTTAVEVYPTAAVSYFDFTTSTETFHVTWNKKSLAPPILWVMFCDTPCFT
jgi:hypothetical protein